MKSVPGFLNNRFRLTCLLESASEQALIGRQVSSICMG
jgi:hypothetical protein